MSEVTVPDIGDFTDVPVIEVLVAPGDTVAAEDPLIVLESDKASMDVPAPAAGTVGELLVKVGDTVSKGTPILTLESDGAAGGRARSSRPSRRSPPSRSSLPSDGDGGGDRADVVVLGSGPGGYTAAFRAADLGLKTVLVERYERLGGVCLNVGCIPSKALLHLARVLADAEESAGQGITFGEPEIDLDGVRAFKDGAVERLTGGLAGMAKTREVEVVRGTARFTGPNALDVDGTEIAFEHAIIAAGSQRRRRSRTCPTTRGSSTPPARSSSPDVPERLLVIGGGIIGLEMATVYDALGSKVTVVEMLDQLIAGRRQGPRQAAAASGSRSATRRSTWTRKVEASRPPTTGSRVSFEGEPRGDVRPRARRGRPPPQRRRHRRRRGGRRGRRARLHRRRRADAHQRRRTSSPSATSSASRCSPTRPRTRARSPPR